MRSPVNSVAGGGAVRPDISVIIINWNTRQLLLDCIASLHRTVRQAACEVFVVDNGSTDGSTEAVSAAWPDTRVIAIGRNEGFARANNHALRLMNGRYALLLNSDTILQEGALESMLRFMDARPEAGMCGPQLLNADGTFQTSNGVFPELPVEFLNSSLAKLVFPDVYRRSRTLPPDASGEARPVDFIIGACMMVRREAIEAAGMLDEDYFFFYEEIDWCWRVMKKGWKIFTLPEAQVVHFGGGSRAAINLRTRAEAWRSRYLFFAKTRRLGGVGRALLFLAGLLQVLYQTAVHICMNIVSLFLVRRARNRLKMFSYLLLWHVRGRPDSMCLLRPR